MERSCLARGRSFRHVEVNVRLRPDKDGEFQAVAEQMMESGTELLSLVPTALLLGKEGTCLDMFEDVTDQDDLLTCLLAPFVSKGSLVFKSESGNEWAYQFDGKESVRG